MSVMGQLRSNPLWKAELCVVEYEGGSLRGASTLFIPSVETREAMATLNCSGFDVSKLLANISRNKKDVVVATRFIHPESFRVSRRTPAPTTLPLDFVRNITRVGESRGVAWYPNRALGYTLDQWQALDQNGQAGIVLRRYTASAIREQPGAVRQSRRMALTTPKPTRRIMATATGLMRGEAGGKKQGALVTGSSCRGQRGVTARGASAYVNSEAQ